MRVPSCSLEAQDGPTPPLANAAHVLEGSAHVAPLCLCRTRAPELAREIRRQTGRTLVLRCMSVAPLWPGRPDSSPAVGGRSLFSGLTTPRFGRTNGRR